MTGPQRSLTAEEQNAILGSVTTLLVHRLPGDWEELLLDLRVMGGHVESAVSVLTVFGRSIDWDLPDEALPFFAQLRAGMYEPERGTWFSARYHLVHPSRYSIAYERNAEPDWTCRPAQRSHLEELGLFPRTGDAIPEWLRERAGLATSTLSRLHEVPVFDGTDVQGRPVFDRPPVHPQDREEILAYLENAPVVLVASGFGQDVFDSQAAPDVPLTFHTDGTYVWSGATPYYLRKRNAPPIPQLVRHIRRNGYAVPPVDDDTSRDAVAVVTGQAAPSPLPDHQPPVITERDRAILEKLRERLERFGVAPHEYGILEAKPDAVVIEPVPDGDGWQFSFWDSGRGPSGRSATFPNVLAASEAMLGNLLLCPSRDLVRPSVIEALPDEPPMSLFQGREQVELPPGAEIDRFGDASGNLVYAARTPYGNRSLPPDWVNRGYHVYQVQRPIPAVRGVAVPWFGQVGGGTGFFLVRSVADLLVDGCLVEVPVAGTEPPPPQD
jgi:hypothetical protein